MEKKKEKKDSRAPDKASNGGERGGCAGNGRDIRNIEEESRTSYRTAKR